LFIVFLRFGVVDDDEIGVESDKLISVGAATPECQGSATYRFGQSEHKFNTK
jgi:hypothetical protein